MSCVKDDFAAALSAVNAPGVVLPPWGVDLKPGSELSARKNSIGIMGGCTIEHDHADPDDACVLVEFAVVWNNDARELAAHRTNKREVATARAMVAAFNLLARHGEAIASALSDDHDASGKDDWA